MDDPKVPPGRNFCKCAACGLRFLNVRAFDKHRAGPSRDRGCMTTPQLSEVGLELTPEGYWRLPKREVGAFAG
jgi:hypothetical protein